MGKTTDNFIDLQSFADITSAIMSAGLEPDKWPDVLRMLTTHSDGVKTQIIGHDFASNLHLGIVYNDYSDELQNAYSAYYHDKNSWADGCANAVAGMTLSADEMCPREEFEKSEFYHDLIRNEEDAMGGGGTILFNDQERVFFIGGNVRRVDLDRKQDGWIKLLRLLTPHLQQAFEINRLVGGELLEIQGLVNVTDPQGAAVLAVNRERRVTYANYNAKLMLAAGDIIREDFAGRVCFVDPGAEAPLAKALFSLSVPDLGAPVSFAAGADIGGIPHICRTARIDPAFADGHALKVHAAMSEPSLMLTIAPQPASKDIVTVLRQIYGLTRQEARVVIEVANGKPPGDIADERSVSVHTIRSQLKSAMFKMEVRRQAEIVKVVGALAS